MRAVESSVHVFIPQHCTPFPTTHQLLVASEHQLGTCRADAKFPLISWPNACMSYLKSRALSEFEPLRWHAGGTPNDNDELVRDWLSRDCRLSKIVVIKETRLPEVSSPLCARECVVCARCCLRDAIHGKQDRWVGFSFGVFNIFSILTEMRSWLDILCESCVFFATNKGEKWCTFSRRAFFLYSLESPARTRTLSSLLVRYTLSASK